MSKDRLIYAPQYVSLEILEILQLLRVIDCWTAIRVEDAYVASDVELPLEKRETMYAE